MSNGKWLTRAHLLNFHFLELIGSKRHVFNFDNHLVITMKNVTYIYLLASVHALSID